VVLCAVLATACGGGGGGNAAPQSPSPTPSAHASATHAPTSGGAAQQAIKANWQAFFAEKTPLKHSLRILQHGQRFRSTIEQQQKSTLAQNAAAKVTKVHLVSPTKANVTYTILTGGKPVLQGQHGVALKIGGTWKISAASFCALLHLEGQHPSACPSPSSSG
jgi:hypothetical protein